MIQQGGNPRVQRFAACEGPDDCPQREAGEVTESRATPMLVAGTSDPNGLIAANFGIGRSAVKPGLTADPLFSDYMRQMAARPQTRFNILGFSDCEGGEARNRSLRSQRANALREALPESARGQVNTTAAAPLGDCIQSNRTARGRSLNRSALLYETGDCL